MENPYDRFTPSDFVADDAFLQHHLRPTAASVEFWNGWLAAHPRHRETWQQAQTLLEAVRAGLSTYSRAYLSEEEEARLLARIHATNARADAPARVVPLGGSHWVRYAAAACLVLGIGAGAWLWQDTRPAPTRYQRQLARLDGALNERVNATARPQLLRLPDGTTVRLHPGSRLGYARNFGQTDRAVYLSGQAEFDVVWQPNRPFLVFANDVVARVLGTRFEVNAYPRNTNVTVRVRTGRVTVYRYDEQAAVGRPRPSGVLVLPNQQLVFTRKTEQFSKALVEDPVLLLPKPEQPDFVYDETPVVVVFQQLETAYGVEIIADRQALAGCQLTATLRDETLAEKIDVICQSIGATYEVVDARIIVTSAGCPTD